MTMAQRIRTIKPQFWGSHDTARLSRDARLLFIGLISMADDEGRFLASSAAISGYVFPNDEIPAKKLREWVNELADVGVIHLYNIQGVSYGQIPTFRTHQRISHPMESVLPGPENAE